MGNGGTTRDILWLGDEWPGSRPGPLFLSRFGFTGPISLASASLWVSELSVLWEQGW